MTQVHSQYPGCFLEVGWDSRTWALQRTGVSLDGNPCRCVASEPLSGWVARALQGGRSWTGDGAKGGAASQATGQRVAGGGAARTRSSEQFRAEAGMASGMLGQVVTAGEALGAQGTGEPLLARVRPVVAGQLIRTGKLLVTARPVTGKGPLTWTKKKNKKQSG